MVSVDSHFFVLAFDQASERHSTRRAKKIVIQGLTVHRKDEEREARTTVSLAERKRKGNHGLQGQPRRRWRKGAARGRARRAVELQAGATFPGTRGSDQGGGRDGALGRQQRSSRRAWPPARRR